MSGNQNETAAATENETEPETTGPLGRLRLLPSATFGIRAAALTRVALPVAMVTTGLAVGGLAGGAQHLAAPMDTTCCPLA